MCRRSSGKRGPCSAHVYACKCRARSEKGATGMNKNLRPVSLGKQTVLSGFRMASGHVGKRQWHCKMLNSTSNYGLSDQGLSLEYGFQIIQFISQNTCEGFFLFVWFCCLVLVWISFFFFSFAPRAGANEASEKDYHCDFKSQTSSFFLLRLPRQTYIFKGKFYNTVSPVLAYC